MDYDFPFVSHPRSPSRYFGAREDDAGSNARLPLVPIEPGAAVAAPQRALGDLLRAGRAGSGSPDPRAHAADEAGEPRPQAREEGAKHLGPFGCPLCGAAQLYSTSDVGPTASQRGPNYAGQDEEDGRQGQAEAHADRLSKLVRLEFRPLCRGRHVAGVHPSRGRVEHFWI